MLTQKKNDRGRREAPELEVRILQKRR